MACNKKAGFGNATKNNLLNKGLNITIRIGLIIIITNTLTPYRGKKRFLQCFECLASIEYIRISVSGRVGMILTVNVSLDYSNACGDFLFGRYCLSNGDLAKMNLVSDCYNKYVQYMYTNAGFSGITLKQGELIPRRIHPRD